MAQEGSSVIKWNDLIFRNFKEGNLKTLDFHFYRSLESGIAKRMFRFLDKRFHFRSRLSFVLEASDLTLVKNGSKGEQFQRDAAP